MILLNTYVQDIGFRKGSHDTVFERQERKANFKIWRHNVEPVYLGYTQNKSQHRVRIACLSSRGRGRNGSTGLNRKVRLGKQGKVNRTDDNWPT